MMCQILIEPNLSSVNFTFGFPDSNFLKVDRRHVIVTNFSHSALKKFIVLWKKLSSSLFPPLVLLKKMRIFYMCLSTN